MAAAGSLFTQLLDGMIRTINKVHVASEAIDFVVFTGDATDNAQRNELAWFITAFDGGLIDRSPGGRSGPADRPESVARPASIVRRPGLYQRGVHGERRPSGGKAALCLGTMIDSRVRTFQSRPTCLGNAKPSAAGATGLAVDSAGAQSVGISGMGADHAGISGPPKWLCRRFVRGRTDGRFITIVNSSKLI